MLRLLGRVSTGRSGEPDQPYVAYFYTLFVVLHRMRIRANIPRALSPAARGTARPETESRAFLRDESARSRFRTTNIRISPRHVSNPYVSYHAYVHALRVCTYECGRAVSVCARARTCIKKTRTPCTCVYTRVARMSAQKRLYTLLARCGKLSTLFNPSYRSPFVSPTFECREKKKNELLILASFSLHARIITDTVCKIPVVRNARRAAARIVVFCVERKGRREVADGMPRDC